MRKIPLIMALALVLVFGLAMQAAADTTFTSHITVPKANENFNESTVPPPYTDVVITVDDSGIAKVKFDATPYGYLLGSVIGVNLSQDATLDEDKDITFSSPVDTPGFNSQSTTTPPQVSNTFGDFTLNVSFDDAFGHGFGGVTFYLTGTWDNANSVLAFNSDGFDAYCHVSNNLAGDLNSTGFAGEPVPIPAALPLFGSGLLGLIGLGWRTVRS
jgi:hypothetical protein